MGTETWSSVTLRDGTRLAYEIDDFTDPWRPADPVVLVHGFSKNRRFWYSWVPALARRYRVIRVDLRGHGDSSLPSPDFTMDLAPFAADLDEFLGKVGFASAHWVFAEFATAVAIEFAVRYPERLRSLTLAGLTVNPSQSTVNFDEWADLIEQQGAEAWARATNHFRLPPDADPGLKEWYVREQGRMPDALMAAVMRFVKTVNLTDTLPQIRVPVLIVAGSAGVVESIDGVRQAAAKIPNCELAVIEGAPLNVMNARPDAAIAATLDFLGRHAAAGAPAELG